VPKILAFLASFRVGKKFVPIELSQAKQKLKLRRDLSSYALWLSKMELRRIAEREKRLKKIAKNAANLKPFWR
jgi:hypothetical protein